MRHIAVIGVSFCGSTVLTYVLGGLPGVANVGESFWAAEGSSHAVCRYCHPEPCPHWTEAFVAGLRENQQDWYKRLAAQMQSDIIVSSDKIVRVLRRFDPELELDALLSFRPPIDAYRSYRTKAVPPPGQELMDMNGYLSWWARLYKQGLDADNKGKKVCLEFEGFRREPAEVLQRLCTALELPYDVKALEYWKRPQHLIGGHFNAFGDERGVSELRISENTTPPYTDEERAGLEAHKDAVGVYERLRSLAV